MSENLLKIDVFEGMVSVWLKISGTPNILRVAKLDEWIFYMVKEF